MNERIWDEMVHAPRARVDFNRVLDLCYRRSRWCCLLLAATRYEGGKQSGRTERGQRKVLVLDGATEDVAARMTSARSESHYTNQEGLHTKTWRRGWSSVKRTRADAVNAPECRRRGYPALSPRALKLASAFDPDHHGDSYETAPMAC